MRKVETLASGFQFVLVFVAVCLCKEAVGSGYVRYKTGGWCGGRQVECSFGCAFARRRWMVENY
ncbi:hypothetical protein GBA52_023245 [Prunus armeniaca]|nr:hypothetical protein GBA52_023245 [Prunus armeniaca]